MRRTALLQTAFEMLTYEPVRSAFSAVCASHYIHSEKLDLLLRTGSREQSSLPGTQAVGLFDNRGSAVTGQVDVFPYQFSARIDFKRTAITAFGDQHAAVIEHLMLAEDRSEEVFRAAVAAGVVNAGR